MLRVLLESISCFTEFVHVKDSELSTEGFYWSPTVPLLGLFRNFYMSKTVRVFTGIQQVLDIEINFAHGYG